jgi:fructose-1,6-bisphosphatase/inositol monophosphatase family enzyme
VVAIADGPTLAHVRLGYIEDYTRGEAYLGVRRAGTAATRRLEPAREAEEVELILLEAGRPDRHHFDFGKVARLAPKGSKTGLRVRQIGSLALAICHVAIGVADVVLTPVPSRAVDVAGALLLVREAGGGASSLDGRDLWSQPLDLARRSPLLAWRRGIDGEALLPRAQSVFQA